MNECYYHIMFHYAFIIFKSSAFCNDDDDGSLPEGSFIGVYASQRWDE